MVSAQGLGKSRGTNSVEGPVRPYQSILIFLLISVAFILVQLAPHSPAPAAARIRLELPDDVPIADFLRALADATSEPVIWSAKCKEIRRKRTIGEIIWEGSRQSVLSDAGSLLTFYEFKMVSVGSAHGRVHVVTYDPHTSVQFSHD